MLEETGSALEISGGKPHLPKYTSVSFECKAPTENFRHTHSKRTHPPGHHLRSGAWWTVFFLKGKKVFSSFCMRASGTIFSPGAGRLLSRLLLILEHGSMGMFSSAVKPPREMPPWNHSCSHSAALVSDFLTNVWVCAGNWVTRKIQDKAENQQKNTYFGYFS